MAISGPKIKRMTTILAKVVIAMVTTPENVKPTRKMTMRTEVLETVLWHDENWSGIGGTGCYTMPPPWPPDMWKITRFEVQENGAVLHLWFTSIPAERANE
jgi:hypothetical protein